MTAIGTGGRRYARAFIEDEDVPFDVLLDENGTAARIIEVNTIALRSLTKPGGYSAALRSLAEGHRQHKTGRRPMQLGATVVMAPSNDMVYIDREDFAGDHADLEEVLEAVRERSPDGSA